MSDAAIPRRSLRNPFNRALGAGPMRLAGIAALGVSTVIPSRGWAPEVESHGLSSFGDLKYPPGFARFDYVRPDAPKGGSFSLQIASLTGNQNFDTFNTLNTFVLQGDGAAGMDACFDSLMTGSGAEGFVIVEGDHVEDQGFERRMVGAQQRLGAPGAFLRRQPDDGRARRGGGGLGDPDAHQGGQAQGRRDSGAVCQELAAGESAQPSLVAVEIPDLVDFKIDIAAMIHNAGAPGYRTKH